VKAMARVGSRTGFWHSLVLDSRFLGTAGRSLIPAGRTLRGWAL
jgi:hypothetical protein